MVKFDDIPPYVPEGARSFARRYLGEYGPQLIESENKLYRLAESIRECQKQLAETSSGEISESWHKMIQGKGKQSEKFPPQCYGLSDR